MIESLEKLSQELWRLGLKKSSEQVILLKEAGKKEELIDQNPDLEAELVLAGEVVKPGFLSWVVKQLRNKEPISEIIDMIKQFEKFKPRLEKKDLYQYETLGELRGAIEEGGLSRKDQKIKAKDDIFNEYEILYEDKDYLVVHPHTKAASCYFGRGTRWCVSATVSKNHFNEYAAGNSFLYFILSKEPTIADLEKIAYNIEKRNDVNRIDIFNSLDELINEEEVEDYLGEKFNIIKSAITEHNNSHEETAVNELIQRLTPEDVEKQLKEIKNWKEEEELEDLFWGSYKTPGDIIRVLYNNMKSKRRFDSKDGEHDLRLVAFHPNTPSDVLIDIFLNYKRHLDLRHFVEYSRAVSSEVLKFIFFHSDLDYLRPLIISHYKLLSSDLKEIIPLIKIEDIRKLTKTPTENNIEVLLRFSDLDIRYELIQMFHDKIPYHILNELASDSDDKTRYLIATHTYDLGILKRLAKDPVRYVSLAAQYRIKYNPDLYR